MNRIAIAIAAILVFLTGCNNTAAPESTVGAYSNDEFQAVVETDSIHVYIVEGDTKILYWKGTWKDGESEVKSAADRRALDKSILGSGADDKVFTVDDSSLGFEFQALGSTTNVSLDKD